MYEMKDKNISEYLKIVSKPDHNAGGGSVAALNGALAASLVLKAYNMLSKDKDFSKSTLLPDFEANVLSIKRFFEEAIQKDGESFGEVLKSWQLPKNTKEEILYRKEASEIAIQNAVKSPFLIMEKSVYLFEYILILLNFTNDMINTELVVAKNQLNALFYSAIINFDINLKYVKDKKFIEDMREKAQILKLNLEKYNLKFDKNLNK